MFKESFGATLVAVLMAALVAVAILVPGEGGNVQSLDPLSASNDSPLASDGGPFTALQKNEIRNTVREYLLENPQVVVEALESLQEQQQQSEGRRRQNAVTARADQLFRTRSDPSVGDPKASVTIVEFFDYQCPYCRRMAQQLAKLNAEDPDLRIVYKEYPVFGPASTLAARAAVGAMRQGKYEEFHLALMGIRGAPSERSIFRVAERIGLDAGRLRADMNSATPQRLFQRNRQLAQELGIRGTPAFVVGDQVIPGFIEIRRLRQLIAEERKRQQS
ncbi:MAG: DsbA family protein [Alphaproteobacteria bacterium]|nr:DsbA family protein [Alphaproteobacteria bacterium]MCZ6587222.1 DsbA family protein [Alphaproteobacteria bacterium]MCZ6591082.1 DsbA family protein [Alphaproteobacteria bacterium]